MIETKKINFPNHHGHMLSALLDSPVLIPTQSYALFAHCFTCSKDFAVATRLAQCLAEQGIATLRFDFTGLGQREGDFSNSNFSSNLHDLDAAVDFLSRQFQAPDLLIGHSLGGTAALASAHKIKNLKALVLIGAPSHPAHVGKHLEKHEHHYTFNLGQTNYRVSEQFIADIEAFNLHEHLPKHKLDTLIMHSPIDNVVNIEHAQKIYTQLNHPKSFISLDQADHLLSNKQDARYVGQLIASWFQRNIKNNADAIVDDVQVEEVKQPFTQKITVGKHILIADEPLSIGGKNLGPSPYELLLSALGACTAMTLRMYANHKKINLEKISVKLSHKRINAKDLEGDHEKTGKIDIMQRRVYITGDLTEELQQKLLSIADRCPVHTTLQSKSKVITQINPKDEI